MAKADASKPDAGQSRGEHQEAKEPAKPSDLLPVLPIKNTVLFPHLLMPLAVGRAGSVAAVDAALATEDKTLVVVTQKDGSQDQPKPDDLFAVGTFAVIKRMERAEQTVQLIVQGIDRVRLTSFSQTEPFLKAEVLHVPEPFDENTEVEALHRAVLDLAGRIHAMAQPDAQTGLEQIIGQVSEPLHQVYLLASMLSLDVEKAQSLLEAASRRDALQLLHDYLSHEVLVFELRQKIASQAQSELTKEQREYLLRRQLSAIQEELGEASPEQAEVEELRKRLDETELPDDIRKEAQRELSRLERLPSAAPDYQLTRTYVELVIELPWTKTTEDNLDLVRAQNVLDEDHYDLKEIKERIIEHLAVMKLNPQAKAPILCFVGPPGVGKTSLGQSIARALGRKFDRMSLGGLHDEAELRGHRRTYIGAMHGLSIQSLRHAGVKNPLLMLDEVDKLGRDFRGDPSAALMEILDPAQNFEFRDNYLDLPFDLTKVFFITTANTLDTVPQPLLDRMETLRLAGYTDEEKVQIARRYLIPRQLQETGLKADQLEFPDNTLHHIIRRYTREAGLRQLDRALGSLARKVATRFAQGKSEPVRPAPDDLSELLGPEKFFAEEARKELPPGVAAGLAWTEAGGEVLYVEAILLPGGSGLTLTGHLGEVMQESAKAAQSYIRYHAKELGIDGEKIDKSGVHIHVPAGAVPKDGPSAGVTMAATLTSLYTGLPTASDVAMTGEITLTGLVLPVGGVKEKVLAARRAGFRHLILPADNRKDLRDLPDEVRRELRFDFAEKLEDVLEAAIPELSERLALAGAN